MQVAKLTIEQKDLLVEQKLQDNWYFNPEMDADGNWVISLEEVNNNMNSDYAWLKDLEIIDWSAPNTISPII